MDTASLLSRLAAGGARLAARPEAPELDAPLTFGAVPVEYEAGVEGAGLLYAADRGCVRVEGGEAAAFLHRLLANDVRGLAPGGGNRNLLLSPKGKVLCDFDLLRDEDGLTLSTPPGRAAGLLTALDTFLFAEDVRLADASEAHAPLELAGPRAREVAAGVLGALPELPLGHHALRPWSAPTGEVAVRVAACRVAGSPGLRLDAGAAVPHLWDALHEAGARPLGLAARDMLRVEVGAGLFGVDVDENVYPQEARLEEAFALDKGCYVGQEVVAKIDTYGGLNKRLEALSLSGDEPVARGTRLVKADDDERRELGLVTSWAWSFVLDRAVALAYVKRKHQEPGTVFELDGTGQTGTLVALPIRG